MMKSTIKKTNTLNMCKFCGKTFINYIYFKNHKCKKTKKLIY